MFGGPLISTIGIPAACMVGAVGFPLSGSGFYVNSKYGIQWYLIFAKGIYGISKFSLALSQTSTPFTCVLLSLQLLHSYTSPKLLL